MHFFALDTRIAEKIRQRYCTEGEEEVLLTRYHWMSFLFRSVRETFITVALFTVIFFAWEYQWPMYEIIGFAAAIWIIFVFFHILRDYIDWRYDMILLTTEKMVLVDQTSFIRHEEKPIHLENVGGVSSSTQFLNLFPFGTLILHLKEGLGGDAVTLRYVPDAQHVASLISDVVTKYQRKGHLQENDSAASS
jgi:hypothetical protein